MPARLVMLASACVLLAACQAPAPSAVFPPGSRHTADGSPLPVPHVYPAFGAGGVFTAGSSASGKGVSTLAGKLQGFADGVGEKAHFNSPLDVAVSEKGDVYVVDGSNHALRKVASDGTTSTLYREENINPVDFTTPFYGAQGVTLDAEGNAYVVDVVTCQIYKVSPAGELGTHAGTVQGFADGDRRSAQFNSPTDVVRDKLGTLFVADNANNAIRKVAPDGSVTTLAGGPDDTGKLSGPTALALDAKGDLLVVDAGHRRLVRLSLEGVLSELVTDMDLAPGVAADADGNIYFSDKKNRIWRIDATGSRAVLAGDEKGGFEDGAFGTFTAPNGLAVDADGNVYVADRGNHAVRKIRR